MAYLRFKIDIVDDGKTEKILELKSPGFKDTVKAMIKMLVAWFKNRKL